MRILIPILGFSKSGGMKVLINFANYWMRQGHDVTILSATNDLPYYKVDVKIIYRDHYSKPYSLFSVRYISILSGLYFLYAFMKRSSENYDFFIANHNLTAYPVYFAGRKKGVYYIQAYEPEFYNVIGSLFKRNFLAFFAWLTYFLPLVRVVNAKIYLDYKNIKANFCVFPGMDISVFRPRSRPKKSSTDKFIIGCIGRLEKYKGTSDVCDAVKILHDQGYTNIKLVVAFNRVGYNDYELIFPDGDQALSQYYRSLDILVTPGHIQLDAIHYPVIEAMATKTPLITTGYFPSKPGNSFLVPVKSPESIAECIRHVINNYDCALSKADLAFYEVQELSWENVSNNFISILDEVLMVNQS